MSSVLCAYVCSEKDSYAIELVCVCVCERERIVVGHTFWTLYLSSTGCGDVPLGNVHLEHYVCNQNVSFALVLAK